MDVRGLSQALPVRDYDAAEELQGPFRAAALGIAQFYKKASESGRRAYQLGYSNGLQDVLEYLQAGLDHTSGQGGERMALTVERVIDYIERRQEALRAAESDSGEDEGPPAASGSGASTMPRFAAGAQGVLRPSDGSTANARSSTRAQHHVAAAAHAPPAAARALSRRTSPRRPPNLAVDSAAPTPVVTTSSVPTSPVSTFSACLPSGTTDTAQPSTSAAPTPMQSPAPVVQPLDPEFPMHTFPFTFNPFVPTTGTPTSSEPLRSPTRPPFTRRGHHHHYTSARRGKGRMTSPIVERITEHPASVGDSGPAGGYTHYASSIDGAAPGASSAGGKKRQHHLTATPAESVVEVTNDAEDDGALQTVGAGGDALMADVSERPSKRLARR